MSRWGTLTHSAQHRTCAEIEERHNRWKSKAKGHAGLFCFRIKRPSFPAHFSSLQDCFLFVALIKGAGSAGSGQETGGHMGLLSGCWEKNKGTSQTLKKTFYPSRPGTVSIILNSLLVVSPDETFKDLPSQSSLSLNNLEKQNNLSSQGERKGALGPAVSSVYFIDGCELSSIRANTERDSRTAVWEEGH